MRRVPHNKILWTPEQINFMRQNFNSMTNAQLAKSLGIRLTSVRTKLYEMGLYKMRLQYWTPEQIEFLKANYKAMGDTEIADEFTKRWSKGKGWSKKHIEKKRRYLKLKRTAKEIKAIHQRNVDSGMFLQCAVKRWETTGQASEGEIRMWREGKSGRMIPRVKVNGRFINWNRWKWEQEHGEIPKGMFVRFKGDPSILDISNLELVTAEFHKWEVRNNSKDLSDQYVAGILTLKRPDLRKAVLENPELIELKRNQLLLNRAIRNHDKI